MPRQRNAASISYDRISGECLSQSECRGGGDRLSRFPQDAELLIIARVKKESCRCTAGHGRRDVLTTRIVTSGSTVHVAGRVRNPHRMAPRLCLDQSPPSSPARCRKVSSYATGHPALPRYRNRAAGQHRIAEIHATSLERLSKVDHSDDPTPDTTSGRLRWRHFAGHHELICRSIRLKQLCVSQMPKLRVDATAPKLW